MSLCLEDFIRSKTDWALLALSDVSHPRIPHRFNPTPLNLRSLWEWVANQEHPEIYPMPNIKKKGLRAFASFVMNPLVQTTIARIRA